MAKVLYEINKARVPSVYHCDVDTIRPVFRETAEVFNAALTDGFFHIEFEEDRRALRLVGEGEGWAKLPRPGKGERGDSPTAYPPRIAKVAGACNTCAVEIVPGDVYYGVPTDNNKRLCADCVPEDPASPEGSAATGDEDDSAEI